MMQGISEDRNGKDLAVLSLDAALELDALLRGEEITRLSTELLAKRLSHVPAESSSSDRLSLDTDPIAMDILNRAFVESHDQRLESIQQLLENISSIREGFTSVGPNSDKAHIKELIAFCVSFHRALTAENFRESDEDIPVTENEFTSCRC